MIQSIYDNLIFTYKYDQKLCDQPNYYLEGNLVAKFLNGIVYIHPLATIGRCQKFILIIKFRQELLCGLYDLLDHC